MGYEQLLIHCIGDYWLQADWAALHKTKSWKAALWHVFLYGLPFMILTRHFLPLVLIVGTHLLIDKFALAKYLCYAKNNLAPRWITVHRLVGICEECQVPTTLTHSDEAHKLACYRCKSSEHMTMKPNLGYDTEVRNYPWEECKGNGYHEKKPIWLTTWLFILTDNSMHLCINYLVLRYLDLGLSLDQLLSVGR